MQCTSGGGSNHRKNKIFVSYKSISSINWYKILRKIYYSQRTI